MVIYFTGTGNSRYVAEAIADRIGDEAVCANDYIRKGENGSFTGRKPWVFVFPIYVSTIAGIAADFIRNVELFGSRRAYFVATCASYMGIAPNVCYDICKAKRLKYMGTSKVDMPQNYIACFKTKGPEECKRIVSDARPAIDDISSAINDGRMLGKRLASRGEYDITVLCEKLYSKYFTKTDKFYATDACNGCGTCRKVCPLGNISLSQKRPVWSKNCVHCMACINSCPKNAIEYGRGTIGRPRYKCVKYKKDRTV